LTKCSKEGIEAPGQAGSCSSLEPVLWRTCGGNEKDGFHLIFLFPHFDKIF
jgi:hypothetical protein